jgi:hypothetical protein
MSIATELWFKNLRENKLSGAKKPQRLDEISEYAAKETFDYMADNGPRIQTEFDDIFDGAMRKVIPLHDSDTQKILQVVRVLKSEGWRPPYISDGPAVAFPTKMVKQKMQRLADEGGGTYYKEIRVASFDLVKEFDYKIPAGPRKGEIIKKTNKSTMTRAIQNAVKFKRLPAELLDWWRQKQTFYTRNEDTYTLIEDAFEGNIPDDTWSIIISRHPVDVLRMSDLPGMNSCHREGGSYFKCAVEESKGNGLIAYLVNANELNSFLRMPADDTEAQFKYQAEKSLWHWLGFEAALTTANVALSKDDPEQLDFVLDFVKNQIKGYQRSWRGYGAGYGDKVADQLTLDMLRDAVRAKMNNEPAWPNEDELPAPAPISDFDQQEIFRDPERNIKGIGATSRVRMRKFYDTASDIYFTVPEKRLYGDTGADRFRTAVQEWAWDSQKFKFMDDENLELPRASYLVRYGGSYEDTSDGVLLNNFFSMSGQKVSEYGYGNVRHEYDDERDNAFEVAEEELEEVLDSVNNSAEHVRFYAEINHEAEEPSVWGNAQASFEFDVDWKGDWKPEGGSYLWPDEEREYTPIPRPYSYSTESREFRQLLDDAVPEYPDETEWNMGRDGLEVTFTFRFEEFDVADYENFAENILSEIDEDYDEIFQKMRRALVGDDYIPPNDFDRLADDIAEQSKELKNFTVLGIDDDGDLDDDGEIHFLFKPAGAAGPRLGAAYPTIPVPGYFPGIIGNTPEALRSIFGSSAEIKDRRKINPGVAFYNMLIHDSQPLVDAANGYVEQQLEFEFGDRYNRPSYEPIDFGHAIIRFELQAPYGDQTRGAEVYFSLKLVVDASSDEADIAGAFEFMRFIDKYPNQITKLVIDTYEKFLDNRLNDLKEKEKRKLDGTELKRLENEVKSLYDARAIAGDEDAEQVMILLMFIKQNWDKFNKFEKLAAIDHYLIPLVARTTRPYGIWDNQEERPRAWDRIVQSGMRNANVPGADNYTWGGDWVPGAENTTIMQNILGMTDEESRDADSRLRGLSDEERSNALDALRRGDREEFVRIIRGSVNESIEERIDGIFQTLTEREPIDLRLYKVALGCIVDTEVAGTDSQIENQIRGIEEVTTVSHKADLERRLGQNVLYRVYEVKFELYGQQARDTYRDAKLVPSIEKEVKGVTVRDRGLPELADAPLREWGGLGYAAPPYDQNLPTMVTPRVSLNVVLEDWAEGGVQIYDTPMNTNQMQYHVMIPVEELWPYSSRFYRGSKADFDGRYKHFIKNGPQMPVYVALGQNGRVRITGNEDIIWFAKKSGLEEVPVFFSYQRQV